MRLTTSHGPRRYPDIHEAMLRVSGIGFLFRLKAFMDSLQRRSLSSHVADITRARTNLILGYHVKYNWCNPFVDLTVNVEGLVVRRPELVVLTDQPIVVELFLFCQLPKEGGAEFE